MLVIFFSSTALPAQSVPRPLIQFRNHFSQTVGLLGPVISPSQGRYLNIGQHQHRINAYTHTPNIHALRGIPTHDPSVRASEDSSCLRPRGYCDRLYARIVNTNHLSVIISRLNNVTLQKGHKYVPPGALAQSV
jgi:hypothetical protein